MELTNFQTRFSHLLRKHLKNTAVEQQEQETPCKPKFVTEVIWTFIKYEENITAQRLLLEIEQSLQKHTENEQREAVPTAVVMLLTSKKEKFKNMNDPEVKQLFGRCSFKVVQDLVDKAAELKCLLSDDCINYVFKNKLKLQQPLWECTQYEFKQINPLPDVPDYFYWPLEDIFEDRNATGMQSAPEFRMNYEATNGMTFCQGSSLSGKSLLAELYEMHKCHVHLNLDEFTATILPILESNKSNSELQNDLFEVLGFDAFELISMLLDERAKITTDKDKPTKADTKRRNVGGETSKRQNAPAISSQITVQSQEEKTLAKQFRKIEKKNARFAGYEYDDNYETVELREAQFMKSMTQLTKKNYPNVFDETTDVTIKAMICGRPTNIPQNAIRLNRPTYEEITIPPKKSSDIPFQIDRFSVASLDQIGQMVFKDIDCFNTIQSKVLPIAYHTNENMLICAPTGAGKTNIALLTIVNQIKNFIVNDVVRLDQFKIVYICPMKALAAEMTQNFSKKLLPLGIKVKECTGDMQLTRKEIGETQMLVTTPEKWDVITRKGTTDAELTSLLKLLIIDEVHLLNSDRGPVIEALVARTLRQVVNSQNMIRIIGLSATLPNYIDVSHFLRVNPEIGLFYFDGRFRSVPLTQTFIGVKTTKQMQQNADIDEVCFDKVVEFLRAGHQVMVFVHARNQTTRTATYLKETAQTRGVINLFEPDKSFKAKKAGWGGKALDNFLPFGLGVHHAGMLRRDRNEVERCFMDGAIKVLCCTATLAWGVNLPAHGVIIKGTKLYDSKKSAYVDLDVLDVLQIFGRAGRPQFDSSGQGIIITSQDKVTFYLSSLTNQIPIESKLLNALTDNLNAEIVLGSISSIQEAVEWLTFTYLHRRMKMNPLNYGLQYADLQEDPNLRPAMLNYVHTAAQLLDKAHMIRYDSKTGDLTSTNLGRTASYYYINFDTVEVFNDMMNTAMTEADIVGMMCMATEFQQIQVRQEELEDLDDLMDKYCEWNVSGGVENVHGKVNILMQSYLSRGYIKSLSLASDMEYITQSAARIARSLFDIAIHQNKALLAGRCLLVAQMFEARLWPFETPMRQFKQLETTVMNSIEQYNLQILDMKEMDEKQVGNAIRNVRLGAKAKYCADAFPYVEIESKIQPITRGVIRVRLFILPNFKWSVTYHGKMTEMFWVWIEDPDTDQIYHTETISITKNICAKGDPIELVFTVPLIEPRPSQYLVRVSSDRWMYAVYTHALSFMNLQLPQSFTPHTDLLELQPLETSVLKNETYRKLYPFSHFNPIQTQIFHCLYHTDNNVLLGAPTGSGKTIVAEICMLRLFNNAPHLKVVYIAPLKALVRERVDDWKAKFGGELNKNVTEITGDVTPSGAVIASSHIIITTPEKWDGMSRGWQSRNFIRDVGLMIIDEIHLLGEDRGPVLEVIVSRTNFISDRTGRKMRIVGLSTAMANARDLATWLGITEMGLYNFRPSVRPVPLEVHISGFPGKHYCPRMMSMNRPTYQAIRQHAPDSPTLVFCSSRKQTRLTAFDLITYLVTDTDPKQWLHCDDAAMESILANIQDPDLCQFISFGIGIHHAGLQERDRKTVEELFVNHKIQVLIATGTLAWGVNFPAHLVVIKGTEYFDGATKRYVDMPITDVLQMMGRAGRPQFDTSGVACVFVHDIKKNFYKKFLYEPFPVESNLLQVLADHVNAEIAAETVPTKSNLMEYMTWTYFFRRLLENPTYYNLPDVEPQHVNQYLCELVDSVVGVLQESNCVQVTSDENNVYYESTFFGQVASYYYLSHKTMLHFQESLKPNSSMLELMTVMCRAQEYAQFPVRHNEDKINADIAKRLNLKLHGEAFDSPHVKVYILLYMYLSDVELPNQEYKVDCNSVLDQALRILQAMVDITSNSGWLAATLRIINLMQMLVQGRWITEPGLLSLPKVSTASLPTLLRELKSLRSDLDSLAKLRYAAIEDEHHLRTALVNVYGGHVAEQIRKVVRQLPWVELTYAVRGVDDESVESTDYGTIAGPGCEYDICVDFQRRGDPSLEVQMKKFSKRKDEGWFVCVGLKDELCGIKRVTIKRKASSSIRVTMPNYPGNFVYNLFLISDSYVGLDQQYDIPIQVKKS